MSPLTALCWDSCPSTDITMDRRAVAVAAIAAVGTTIAAVASRVQKRKRYRGRQPKYHRRGLLKPISSDSTTAWRQVLSCGSSSDFIATLNFDRYATLSILLPLFQAIRPTVNYGSPYRRGPKLSGRKCGLDSVDILGLVLCYLKSSARQMSLCPMFGLVPSSLQIWVDYGMEVLSKVFKDKHNGHFNVEWPDESAMKASSDNLVKNRPNGRLLKGIFAVVDGGRLPCADYNDVNVQNAFYESYTCNVEVTNIFVFNFFGEVIHAGVNYPGSWHDSKLATVSGLMHPKLGNEMTPPGYAILGDSAFSSLMSVSGGKVVRARKSGETREIPISASLAAIDLVLQRVLPSERQSAEWGIRCLKGPFGRLRLPLSAVATRRGRLLRVCVHLLNLRTRVVGLNQIRTTYASAGVDTAPWTKRFVEEMNVVPI